VTLITSVRRRVSLVAAVALTCLALLAVSGLGVSGPVAAAPGGSTDPEGGTQQLRDQLDAASKGFVDAKAKLATSQQRQRQLTADLGRIEAQVSAETATIGELAGVAYRTGRLGPLTALLGSDSPDGFLDRAMTLSAVAANQDKQVRTLVRAREAAAQAKAAVDREIAEQRRQLAIMQVRKQQAEQALADAAKQAAQPPDSSSSGSSSGGTSSGGTAAPAPRNPDGSWPPESCSVNDPTTSGCITPRTLHALQQAKAAGFTRFVSCYRSGSSGEHPKGRACDFSATSGGFGGVATGDARTYGDNLANYFIRNADRLAVLYVIWFKRIWLPSSGWKAYSGGNGDPSSDHTNHVHLSVI
jgi:peptidoglycan DL-endopeptidase CwlO